MPYKKVPFDYQDLTEAKKKAILRFLIFENPYIRHQPTVKQAEFLLNFKSEVLYGGAAGGGKSDSLLMAALMFVGVPTYSAIIFRRTYSDLALPGALISRSHEWLDNTKAKWNQAEHKWLFPKGSTLSFGYLDTENAQYRYQGAEFQYIGFDELTQFTLEHYTYLFSRLRRLEGSNIPLRMRSASNPGGLGHEWVYARFFVEKDPSREFIPARLADNPFIDQPSYLKSLGNLDPVTKAQLLEGNWIVVAEGNKFKREWFKFVDVEEIPRKGVVIRYWDLAATEAKRGKDPDYAVGAKVRLFEGQYYIEDIKRVRMSPGDVEKLIAQTAYEDGKNVQIFIEQEPGASGKILINDYARRVLVGYALIGDRPTGPKEARANVFSAACFNGNVYLVRAGWNSDFVSECIAFPNAKIHDDQVDAVSAAIGHLPIMDLDFDQGEMTFSEGLDDFGFDRIKMPDVKVSAENLI